MDTCYYSIIERTADSSFVAWVPDLPGLSASGSTEEEVLQHIFRQARECLRDLIVTGQPIPAARSLEELPQHVGGRQCRRLLLVIS